MAEAPMAKKENETDLRAGQVGIVRPENEGATSENGASLKPVETSLSAENKVEKPNEAAKPDVKTKKRLSLGLRSKSKAKPKPKPNLETKAESGKMSDNSLGEETTGAEDGIDVDEYSLPKELNVDFYRGLTREREAEQIARAFIENHFPSPNAAYVYVQKWRDGIAVEMQEGGGRAYLPELLAKLDEDENATSALGMLNRVLQVRLDPDTGNLEGHYLTESQAPSVGAFKALPTAKMIPFDKRGSKVFLAGVGMLGASAIALLFSLGALFLDARAWAIPHVQVTDISKLPSTQAIKLQGVIDGGADCVAKLEFSNGQWTIIQGWDDGNGVCSSSVTQPSRGETALDAIEPYDGQPVDVTLVESQPSVAAEVGPPAMGHDAGGAPHP